MKGTEGDYFYGRGTADDKAQAAVWVATLLRLKREGHRPDRDLILALTADEEGGAIQWRELAAAGALQSHRGRVCNQPRRAVSGSQWEEFRQACVETTGCYKSPESAEAELMALEEKVLLDQEARLRLA